MTSCDVMLTGSLEDPICWSSLVHHGDDEGPRVGQLGLVTPTHHTEASKTILPLCVCVCVGVSRGHEIMCYGCMGIR